MKKKSAILLFFLILSTLNFSCLKSKREDIPGNVREVLEMSGVNRQELLMALEPYLTSGDTVKLNSMYWLIANMCSNYYVKYHIQDTDGNIYRFNPQKFDNYLQLKHYRDSIEQIRGNLLYEPDTFIVDYEAVSKDFLINNLEQAYKSITEYPWAKNYTYAMFNEWILPYRCANEQVEPFRKHFLKKYKNKIKELNTTDPITIAKKLNELINAEIDYKDTYKINANILTLDSLEKLKYGNFYDIAVYKVKALRSFGIAAALDYCPYFADTASGCAWATAFDTKEGEYYLFPNTTVPEIFKNGRMPKTYRRTYKTLKNSLRAVKTIKTKTPPFLGHYDYYDITNGLNATNVSIAMDDTVTKYAYLSVFNDGEWHPVDWAPVNSEKIAVFHKVSSGIVYLPVKMIKGKQFRLAYPFVLADGGIKNFLIPDYKHLAGAIITKAAPYSKLQYGQNYTLYIWDRNWQPFSIFTVTNLPVYLQLPQNGLFLLSNNDLDFDERIFLLDPLGHQEFR